MTIRIEQIDFDTGQFAGSGTDNRVVTIKDGGVSEESLGFAWKTVDLVSSDFAFDGTRSTYTLFQPVTTDANMTDFSILMQNGVDELTQVTTTANPDEWSLAGTVLSIHGDITWRGNSYRLRYVVGSGTGGSAVNNYVWSGLIEQTPLHAKSDYFDNGSLDVKWTEWDAGSRGTISEGDYGVQIESTAGTPDNIVGIAQTAPSDNNFCVTAFMGPRASYDVSYQSFGVFVGEDVISNPTTASAVMSSMVYGTGWIRIQASGFTNYNTWSANYIQLASPYPSPLYLRLYVDRTATTFSYLMSMDGVNWVQIWTHTWASTPVSSVDTIGIECMVNHSTSPIGVYARMFRVDITSDPFFPIGAWLL